ncbi:hypothetical protein LCGC14_2209070 [marine sediment metagenome]|uniref:Uncharacterized protein n=1 Tax=marine sediment metagenome TaxID=412755 RepID=A0A0F9FRQ9_9ZZZZ
MKMIGVAADIYAGLFDGSKYSEKKAPQQKKEDKKDTRSHWCAEHETAFFKTDKMKAFAHNITGTSEWCYEHRSSEPDEQKGPPPLKDLGELFSRAAKFGLSPQDVRAAVEVDTDDDIIDYDEAWKATAKKFAATIKAQQEAK